MVEGKRRSDFSFGGRMSRTASTSELLTTLHHQSLLQLSSGSIAGHSGNSKKEQKPVETQVLPQKKSSGSLSRFLSLSNIISQCNVLKPFHYSHKNVLMYSSNNLSKKFTGDKGKSNSKDSSLSTRSVEIIDKNSASNGSVNDENYHPAETPTSNSSEIKKDKTGSASNSSMNAALKCQPLIFSRSNYKACSTCFHPLIPKPGGYPPLDSSVGGPYFSSTSSYDSRETRRDVSNLDTDKVYSCNSRHMETDEPQKGNINSETPKNLGNINESGQLTESESRKTSANIDVVTSYRSDVDIWKQENCDLEENDSGFREKSGASGSFDSLFLNEERDSMYTDQLPSKNNDYGDPVEDKLVRNDLLFGSCNKYERNALNDVTNKCSSIADGSNCKVIKCDDNKFHGARATSSPDVSENQSSRESCDGEDLIVEVIIHKLNSVIRERLPGVLVDKEFLQSLLESVQKELKEIIKIPSSGVSETLANHVTLKDRIVDSHVQTLDHSRDELLSQSAASNSEIEKCSLGQRSNSSTHDSVKLMLDDRYVELSYLNEKCTAADVIMLSGSLKQAAESDQNLTDRDTFRNGLLDVNSPFFATLPINEAENKIVGVLQSGEETVSDVVNPFNLLARDSNGEFSENKKMSSYRSGVLKDNRESDSKKSFIVKNDCDINIEASGKTVHSEIGELRGYSFGQSIEEFHTSNSDNSSIITSKLFQELPINRDCDDVSIASDSSSSVSDSSSAAARTPPPDSIYDITNDPYFNPMLPVSYQNYWHSNDVVAPDQPLHYPPPLFVDLSNRNLVSTCFSGSDNLAYSNDGLLRTSSEPCIAEKSSSNYFYGESQSNENINFNKEFCESLRQGNKDLNDSELTQYSEHTPRYSEKTSDYNIALGSIGLYRTVSLTNNSAKQDYLQSLSKSRNLSQSQPLQRKDTNDFKNRGLYYNRLGSLDFRVNRSDSVGSQLYTIKEEIEEQALANLEDTYNDYRNDAFMLNQISDSESTYEHELFRSPTDCSENRDQLSKSLGCISVSLQSTSTIGCTISGNLYQMSGSREELSVSQSQPLGLNNCSINIATKLSSSRVNTQSTDKKSIEEFTPSVCIEQTSSEMLDCTSENNCQWVNMENNFLADSSLILNNDKCFVDSLNLSKGYRESSVDDIDNNESNSYSSKNNFNSLGYIVELNDVLHSDRIEEEVSECSSKAITLNKSQGASFSVNSASFVRDKCSSCSGDTTYMCDCDSSSISGEKINSSDTYEESVVGSYVENNELGLSDICYCANEIKCSADEVLHISETEDFCDSKDIDSNESDLASSLKDCYVKPPMMENFDYYSITLSDQTQQEPDFLGSHFESQRSQFSNGGFKPIKENESELPDLLSSLRSGRKSPVLNGFGNQRLSKRHISKSNPDLSDIRPQCVEDGLGVEEWSNDRHALLGNESESGYNPSNEANNIIYSGFNDDCIPEKFNSFQTKSSSMYSGTNDLSSLHLTSSESKGLQTASSMSSSDFGAYASNSNLDTDTFSKASKYHKWNLSSSISDLCSLSKLVDDSHPSVEVQRTSASTSDLSSLTSMDGGASSGPSSLNKSANKSTCGGRTSYMAWTASLDNSDAEEEFVINVQGSGIGGQNFSKYQIDSQYIITIFAFLNTSF